MPTEVEEYLQPENTPATESGPLGQQPMVRSGSSPEVTEPLCPEPPPGISILRTQDPSFCLGRGCVSWGFLL